MTGPSLKTFDTQASGTPVTASGQVFSLGAAGDFYLTLASYLIVGQGTGPAVTFTIYGGRSNGKQITVNYGDVTPPTPLHGTTIVATVPTGSGACAVRVVVSAEPSPISPLVTGVATQSSGLAVIVNKTLPNTNPYTLYTCPANRKASFVAASFGLGSGSGSATYTLYVTRTISSATAYPITPAGGVTVSGTSEYQVGYEPNDNLPLTAPILLLPGDAVVVQVNSISEQPSASLEMYEQAT